MERMLKRMSLLMYTVMLHGTNASVAYRFRHSYLYLRFQLLITTHPSCDPLDRLYFSLEVASVISRPRMCTGRVICRPAIKTFMAQISRYGTTGTFDSSIFQLTAARFVVVVVLVFSTTSLETGPVGTVRPS